MLAPCLRVLHANPHSVDFFRLTSEDPQRMDLFRLAISYSTAWKVEGSIYACRGQQSHAHILDMLMLP
jgi:hypothetical protein